MNDRRMMRVPRQSRGAGSLVRGMSRFAWGMMVLTLGLVSLVRGQDIPELKGLDSFPGLGGSAAPRLKLETRWFRGVEPDTGWLEVRATIPKGWDHMYSVSQPAGGPKPTKIQIESNPAILSIGTFQPDQPPEIVKSIFPVPEEQHHGVVTWLAPLQLKSGTALESLSIQGSVLGQVCRDGACATLEPRDHTFSANYDPTQAVPAVAPTTPPSGRPSVPRNPTVAAPAASDASANQTDATGITSLTQALGLGLLGGMILNLMPCVLPVIGLKIMSFVQQSQGDRQRILLLNIVYSLGILAVLMVLATLSVRFRLSWGEQFTFSGFKIGMIVLVFAMALSFLGVWEIPLPGFMGSGKVAELAAQEGVGGAFFKGVFATILATPCSGPLLGPLFAYTLNKPPSVTYSIFAAVAVGMALPYLWIGAFPELVRWIPKPGAWMSTFKELMAFPLLATVVFLFFALGDSKLFIPTLALCVAVWFACWWIGKTPLTANFRQRAIPWIGGVAIATAVGFVGYQMTGTRHVAWQPYSPAALAKAQSEGKTVLVDFTANWCASCQLNTIRAIDTRRVAELIQTNGVVPLLADWTNEDSPEGMVVKESLAKLGSDSIPLLAIYPAATPDQPLILRDLLSESQVLSAITRAGPSTTQVSANHGTATR